MRATVRCGVVIGCLLAVSPVLAGPSGDLRKASSLVQRGDQAFRSGNLPKAKGFLEEALETLPGFPEAHIGLGHIAMRERRFEDALRSYENAREGYAKVGDLLFQREEKRYLDAQREIRELEDQISQINSGTIKVSESTRTTKTLDLESAIRDLRALPYPHRENATEPPADLFFHMGNALFNLGRVDEALKSWETCIEKKSDHALALNNLAVAYLKTDRIAEARTCVTRAEGLGMEIHPDLKRDIAARAAALGMPAEER